MKHLKYFENNKKSEIWMVPTKKPDFNIAINKIDAGKAFDWLGGNNEDKYVLLHYDDHFPGGKKCRDNWTFSSIDSANYDGIKYISYPEFMGNVEITKDDIEDYYTEKEAEKYNL